LLAITERCVENNDSVIFHFSIQLTSVPNFERAKIKTPLPSIGSGVLEIGSICLQPGCHPASQQSVFQQ
jgi:hypothetical protein